MNLKISKTDLYENCKGESVRLYQLLSEVNNAEFTPTAPS